jgi:hypothetical protein
MSRVTRPLKSLKKNLQLLQKIEIPKIPNVEACDDGPGFSGRPIIGEEIPPLSPAAVSPLDPSFSAQIAA